MLTCACGGGKVNAGCNSDPLACTKPFPQLSFPILCFERIFFVLKLISDFIVKNFRILLYSAFKFFYFYAMCEFLHVSMYIMHLFGVCGGHKSASELLDLKLQMPMSQQVGSGN